MKRYTKLLQSLSILLLLMLTPSKMMAQDIEVLPYNDTTLTTHPSFPGGVAELFKFLSSTIKYPVIAEKNGIHGRVVVGFVVDIDGTLTDIKVKKYVDPALDKEAVRVIKAMPKWIPGTKNGKPVRVEYMLPVTFRLDDTKSGFPVFVGFERGSSTIPKSRFATIKEVANHMNKHPQDTIVVIGNARMKDSVKKRQELSEARTKEVIRTLVEDYHIDENRIINGLTMKGLHKEWDADMVYINLKGKFTPTKQ